MKNNDLVKTIELVKKDKLRNYEELYQLTYQSFYTVAFRILNDHNKVVDALQETYIKIYNNIDSLNNSSAFNSWAKRICINECILLIRATKTTAIYDENTEYFEDDAKSPDKVFYTKQRQEIVRQLVSGLPQPTRVCIILYYIEQFKIKEISNLLTISEEAVKNRLSYGRKRLKSDAMDYEKEQGIKIYSSALLPTLTFIYSNYKPTPPIGVPKKLKLKTSKSTSSLQIVLISVAVIITTAGLIIYPQINRLTRQNNISNSKPIIKEDKDNEYIAQGSNVSLSTLESIVNKNGASYLVNNHSYDEKSFNSFLKDSKINDFRTINNNKIYYKVMWQKTIYIYIENDYIQYNVLKTDDYSDEELLYKLKE